MPTAAWSRAGRGSTRIDPSTLMRLRSLHLRARTVVDGFLLGLHRSPYHGFSVEFSEYRPYVYGDDLRYFDWRLFARSDRRYVKRFEEETNLRCCLLVDLSRSMDYGSVGWSKLDYARTVAATLGYFLWRQRDAVGVLAFDDRVADYVPPRYRPGHLHRLLASLERAAGGRDTRLAPPVAHVARLLRKRGLLVVLSDLLVPVPVIRENLSTLASLGHDVLLIRVLDPRETDFRFDHAVRLEDLESGRQLLVDPAAAGAGYRERFAAHADEVAAIAGGLGMELLTVRTDEPLDRVLFEFLSLRARRGLRMSGGAVGGRR